LGKEEAGGPYGHLYAYKVPLEIGRRTIVHAKLGERPPGSTATVLWLNLLSALIALVIGLRWQDIAVNQTSLAAVALAFPGAVALWFSHLFQAEGRAHLPFVTRGSLWASIWGSTVTLALLLIPSLTEGDETTPVMLNDALRWWFYGLVVLPLVVALGFVVHHRFLYHYRYASRQRNALSKYGL
jgi:hypothetical protein